VKESAMDGVHMSSIKKLVRRLCVELSIKHKDKNALKRLEFIQNKPFAIECHNNVGSHHQKGYSTRIIFNGVKTTHDIIDFSHLITDIHVGGHGD
jgi:type II secretory ATPase GspE/PulE/Tfp pilus assembly ATPase PilB-like protein